MKFFQGDRCNATLGDDCSIQLSYGNICNQYSIFSSRCNRTVCRLTSGRSIRTTRKKMSRKELLSKFIIYEKKKKSNLFSQFYIHDRLLILNGISFPAFLRVILHSVQGTINAAKQSFAAASVWQNEIAGKKAGKMAVIPAFSEEIRLKQQEGKRKLLGIYT